MSETHRTIEAVWRIESARVVATIAGMVRDVGLAEELAQDALVAALEQWPESGVPRNAGAWLTAVAKRRAIDNWRRQERLTAKQQELAHRLETEEQKPVDAAALDPFDDDLLRLIFTACHPVLPKAARVALTLRVLGGLSTEEIARAFLVSTPTMTQRIVRAKRTLAEANVPFEVPDRSEFPERLGSVLEVLYLIYNEGYSATAGDDLLRPGLCLDALRLARILAELVPKEPEVHALVALMELQTSRFATRTTASGDPVLLLDQNRSRWDRLRITRGVAALDRAVSLGRALGPYGLQASIAACHARAARAADTDWARIAALYEALAALRPSPVIELNRAMAVSMAYGPAAGLELIDAIVASGALEKYSLLHSARGDLLARLERVAEARAAFRTAASLTANERERVFLLKRAEGILLGR